jgi:cysteinyl-tRNA synthetase
MWPFRKKPEHVNSAPILFFNTLSNKKERFASIKPGQVLMYSCGPTVYSRAHIGNIRTNVFADLVARVLMTSGYRVQRVINITDVGHLVADAEQGEDKMKVGAEREGLSPMDIAKRYTDLFLEDISALNVDTSAIQFPRATDYIQEQIAMIKTLEEKGFAYKTKDGVYFDTGKFTNYGKLGGVVDSETIEGARVETNREKRGPHDFALWRNAKPGDLQQWDSPWGRGNPGWHIECSAMIRSILGQEIDIHTGGMDLIPVHHNNEIAQTEAITNRTFAHYWIHGAFLMVEGEKISKSLGNDFYVSDIVEKGFHPLALRYFFMQAHYRTPVSFSWTAIASAAEALNRLWRASAQINEESKGKAVYCDMQDRIVAILREDLATPQAIGLLWETIRDEDLSAEEKWGVITAVDPILGLELITPPKDVLPIPTKDLAPDVRRLIEDRDIARGKQNYAEADRIREILQNRGYRVDDGPSGTLLTTLPH